MDARTLMHEPQSGADLSRGPVVCVTEDDLRDLRRVAIEAGLMVIAAWVVLAAVYVLIRGG